MRLLRGFALLVAAGLLAGCQGNPPRFDPFIGPSTVPPPSTAGATLLPPGDPYAPQPAPLLPSAPAVSPQGVPFVPQNAAPTVAPPYAPPAGAPGAGTPYAPPVGGFQYRQSSIGPPAGEAPLAPIAAQPRAIEQASFQSPAPAASADAPAQSSTSERYGHDATYQRLRGQLDYSAIDQSWRLRYIPLSGETDDYGGSVRLREHAALADRRPGEYVEITGHVESAASGDGFAPWYRVTAVRATSN